MGGGLVNLTFGVIGLVFLAGAVVGKSVELGGFKLPATGEKSVRIGLAVLGVLALALGVIPPRSAGQSPQQAAGSEPLTPAAVAPQVTDGETAPATATGLAISPTASPTISPADTPTAVKAGTQLAVYDTVLPDQHGVTLGSSAPAGGQYAQVGPEGDLYLESTSLFASFSGGATLLHLPTAGPPTYRLCTFNAVRDIGVTIASGLSFCLQKTGLVFGITITAVVQSPPQISLHVVVWQDS